MCRIVVGKNRDVRTKKESGILPEVCSKRVRQSGLILFSSPYNQSTNYAYAQDVMYFGPQS